MGITNTIHLKPLEMKAVNELISDIVHSEPTAVAQLAQLVHRKTHGNPFFTIAFLTKLYQTDLLVKFPLTHSQKPYQC